MIRSPRSPLPRLAALSVLAALASVAACGKKGPPLPPLQLVPARIDDFVVRRLGDDIYLQFTVPSRNSNATTPADVHRVNAYGLTGVLVDTSGRPLADLEFKRAAEVVGRVEIAPPPPKDSGERPAEAAPADARPAQGARATVTERVAQAVANPWRPAAAVPERAPESSSDPVRQTPLALPMVSPFVQPPMRFYAVAGESRHGREGPLSQRVGVSLAEPPAAPPAPRVTYDAAKYVIEWQEPEGVRRASDGAPDQGVLVARPVFAGLPTHSYNVYASAASAEANLGVPSPLNPSPLPAPRFEQPGVLFGEERCFAVRTVEGIDRATLESAASPPACVTARDTFPPAAPQNLAAVGGEGAVNLIWEASPDADLAGYLVLRSEAAAGEMRAITPAPIRETTYRDAAVRAGVRYAYVVVAVDSAAPRNVSPHSNRVEETAR